ncbi:GNAT family N-acetyltransferase [Vallitalea okinawensis]|uniref:GNAT family N-acetyltransferase n=1 Tax=Vallitalea okinawensis TaxID=2078660 RepID=UPI000CFD538A|nr:GNAT family N-acetyltransferase [Vallitalea okinawensis]
MMELKKEQFHRIEHMLSVDKCNLEIKSVIALNNPGKVYVDNAREPKSAIIWSKGIGGYYLIGEENNPSFVKGLSQYFDEVIIPQSQDLDYNNIEISGTSEIWDDILEMTFDNRAGYHKSYQYVYQFQGLKDQEVKRPPLLDGAEVKRVDGHFLTSDVNNIDFVKNNILEWWASLDLYLEKGIGYCIVYDSKIVASCVTSFMAGDEMESHIETVEDYQRKGFAKYLIYEYLKDCKNKNLIPYWDCMATNIGSYKTAEWHGYKKAFEYPLFTFAI